MIGENQLEKLAESGVLGILLVLAIVAIIMLYKEIRSLQEKRIEDLKESRDTFLKPLEAIQTMASRTLTLVEKINDAQ